MRFFLPALLACLPAFGQDIPLVYDQENTASDYSVIAFAELSQLEAQPLLPDPFAWHDGSGRSDAFADWERHRSEIMQLLQHYEIGVKPDTPRDQIKAWMDADTLCVRIYANGDSLDLHASITYPEGDGPFPAIIGIGFVPSGSLPPEIFTDRGIAMIGFRFPEVMSHTQARGQEPINRIYPAYEYIGAYSAWPWGISRIIDALQMIPDQARIDTRHLGVTGCSFAGKMALFAGALDERIALTIAQEPGGGGAASWRVSETLGNVERVDRTNYSWFIEDMRQFSGCVDKMPLDHHQLVALVAPRALLVLGNTDYPWLADESGYVSCRAARKVWDAFGIADRMGYSIEGSHMHCMLPASQVPEVEAFVDRFLLDKYADTNITRPGIFYGVEWEKWVDWPN